MDDNGFISTRIKTENGCEKYKKYAKEIDDSFWKEVINESLKRYEYFIEQHKE